MNIGIKYCGGCNPSYDRRKFFERLMNYYSNFLFEPAEDDICYDIVLIVNGCLRVCANHNSLNGKKKIIIKSENDNKKSANC